MFALLDFLYWFRTNPTTGNQFGNTGPVEFTLIDLQNYPKKTKIIFKHKESLEYLLNILDTATYGYEKNSKPVCRQEYELMEGDDGEKTYVVYIFTPNIEKYIEWLKKN